MPLYRKRPVVIEARRVGFSPWRETADWCGGVLVKDGRFYSSIFISTLEGAMRADEGDYIIKGVQGEFYPCKPDIFIQTYEPVEDDWHHAQLVFNSELEGNN